MLGSAGPYKTIWIGDYDAERKEWVKVNKRLEVDVEVTQEECQQRRFIWLEGRCFAIKSYQIHRIFFGNKYTMNEIDDVFVLKQYYAILK